jgi:RNA polymerase sigma factor for flagellar operon FliA
MSDDLEVWRSWRRTRSPAVRDRLVERHLLLVKVAARRLAGRLPRHLHVDDLYSAGLLGLLGAIDDYDPDVGVAFTVYAGPRIRGAMVDELRRLDVLPRAVRRRIRDIERAIDVVSGRLDRPPTDQEIAAELAIDVAAYHQFLADCVTVVSLDAATTPAAGEPLELEDTGTPGPLTALDLTERQRQLGRLVDTLPERERTVLALYYRDELTMREVGEVLGVTESRVSQLHSSAILRLRAALRRQRAVGRDLVATIARAAAGARR